jgi:tRNA(Ile)-lysidine synthase
MNLIKKIQNFAFKNSLWKKEARVVLGVSGGPDSVCLLDIFSQLSEKYDFKLHIVHVNYALREKDSEKDEAFVRELGKKYGISVSIFLPKKTQYRGNLENCLRKIRYDFFEQTRKKLGFDLIAVAHNQDDQAETILMRIIRGSGLNGLGAMKSMSGNIIRPMLCVSRSEILSYIKQKKLKYRFDKSNRNTKFTRNRVRNDLIPYLEKSFNPSIKKTISTYKNKIAAFVIFSLPSFKSSKFPLARSLFV